MMTFAQWKKVLLSDGNFKSLNKADKARYVVRNAKFSNKTGELTDKGYMAAYTYALGLEHSAALLEMKK